MGQLVHDALKVRKLDKKICNMSKKMSEKRNLNGSAMAGGAAASDTAKTNRTRSVLARSMGVRLAGVDTPRRKRCSTAEPKNISMQHKVFEPKH